jgi:hypothetical protein
MPPLAPLALRVNQEEQQPLQPRVQILGARRACGKYTVHVKRKDKKSLGLCCSR